MPLTDWQNGCDKQDLILADRLGANAGLRSGVDDGHGFGWIGIDGDMITGMDLDDPRTERAIKVQRHVVKTLEEICGPIWIRHTIGGRFATFVKVPIEDVTGFGRIIELQHQDFEPGKLECRGRGHLVITGIHRDTHKPITWARSDDPDTHYLVPTDGKFPILKSRAVLEALIDNVMADLAALRITEKAASRGSYSGKRSGKRTDAEKAAPSIAAVQQLLALIIHDRSVSRNQYVEIMIAGVGMLGAMHNLKTIDDDGYSDGAEAFIDWAASWAGGTSYQAEDAKWDDDFSKRGDASGWSTLCRIAVELGVSREDIAVIEAEAQFEFEVAA